jgi:hypothetical protein
MSPTVKLGLCVDLSALFFICCFLDEIPVSNIEYRQHGNDQTQNDVQLNNTDNIVNNNDEDGVFEV